MTEKKVHENANYPPAASAEDITIYLNRKYIKTVAMSDVWDLEPELQAAMMGMIFPTVARDDPHAAAWIEEFEYVNDDDFVHYLVPTKEVISGLEKRGLAYAAQAIKEEVPDLVFCIPLDACVVVQKEQFN